MEARAPITAGVVRSLEHYNPAHLLQESEAGKALAGGLKTLLGDCVKTSDRAQWCTKMRCSTSS